MKKVEKEKQKDNFTKLTQKKGISLIVLIVTIIVIIILAAAVILTITKNNPVDSAKESAFKEDVRIFQDDLALTVAKEYTDKQGQRDQKISTSDYDKITNYIPSFTEKYKDKFIIQDDQLVGTDSLSEKEKTWANDLNISTSGKVAFDATKWDNNATDENCFLWAEDGTTITGLDETKLAGKTKIRIPSKCTAIRSDYAFLGAESYRSFIAGIEEVEIPDTVTEIGNYAFHNFRKLKKINIPNSVNRIGLGAFLLCESLVSVTIPNSVTSIGEYAFDGCSSLTSITIPDSVTSIGSSAFNGCSSLTNITIPESVTSIGAGIFCYCKSLASITIPNSVTSIGGDAFDGCSSLTNITIPDSVASIGIRAFKGCSSLTNITIPDNVTSIESSAFSRCSSLTNINVSDNNKNYRSIDGVLFNKDKTEIIKYPAKKEKTSYDIPNSITSIGEFAFGDCSSLKNITIPDSVTSIGYSAFEYCSSLTNITIPDSVTSIASWAFGGCSSLTNITIPDSVTSIGSNAFYMCSSLTNITIPKSVTSISYCAFDDCSSLTNITYNGTQSQWNKISKYSDWKYNRAIKTITCTDGVIQNN